MDSSIYIPKWLIVAFLAAVGCVAGWMLGAADLVTASIGSAAPSVDSGPPVEGVAASDAAESAGVPDAAAPAVANDAPPPSELALEGAASTTTTAVRIASTPDGLSGVAITPNSNVRIGAVVSDPNVAGPAASPMAGLAPTGSPATTANSVAATAPTAPTPTAPTAPTPTAAAPVAAQPQMAVPQMAVPQMAVPQMAMPQMAMSQMAMSQMAMPSFFPVTGVGAWPFFPPVTGIGAWGPPEPLPPLVSPPFFAEALWNPLPGATSRGVAFSEWESYRTDVAGRNILVTTDDSNFFRDRDGKLNANTGDIDASGLNVIDSADSVIRGSESADEAPWQTMAAALVDLAGDNGVTPPGGDDDDDDNGDDDEDSDEFAEVEEPNGDVPPGTPAPIGTQPTQGSPPTSPTPPTSPAATAAVVPPPYVGGSDDDNGGDGFDFPYEAWVEQANAGNATAVHTDEGTTLASGSDAIVIGADGYDDDDNRAVGENIVITRDDGNVVIGGTGNVNAQIGDAEQGVLVMDVDRTFIQGGGAY
jgi:hypothetical protein